jgi:hypothetical protein
MSATIHLTRRGGLGPGCARPLQVLIDGKKAEPIKCAETRVYTVSAGAHRLQVKQDFCASEEFALRLEEGATQALECGCFVEGPVFFLFIVWFWRTLVPGRLFYVRRATGR